MVSKGTREELFISITEALSGEIANPITELGSCLFEPDIPIYSIGFRGLGHLVGEQPIYGSFE